ncbi:BgtTE-56085 [Blumeria graminis f. sp. tritici]|uniref:BgtTE-56085 n=1 Tax=Blumeria graminis f. sp. tritici TaxID=62690 RepID=A0A9X9QE52_BLUGR|nr:BgtTE-56085 [Blumeria graminis f. sp. tritici]
MSCELLKLFRSLLVGIPLFAAEELPAQIAICTFDCIHCKVAYG